MQSLIDMTQHLVILMTRTSMTPPILEISWREAEEKSRMKPVLITCHIHFMYLTYHTYNHLLYLQIMDHQCLHYDLTLKLHLICKSLCICPQVMTWTKCFEWLRMCRLSHAMFLLSVLAVSPEGRSWKAELQISLDLFVKPLHTPRVELFQKKTPQLFWKLFQT